MERSRRIGQLWLEQLDDLEATAREHAGRSADSARLLAAVTAMMEEAQDFCARMFDPARNPWRSCVPQHSVFPSHARSRTCPLLAAP